MAKTPDAAKANQAEIGTPVQSRFLQDGIATSASGTVPMAVLKLVTEIEERDLSHALRAP